MTSFEGVHAKINRASDQTKLLKADMDRFCENISQSIVHEVHKDADEQVWVFRGTTPNVPIEWSVRLGEIFYNLRSALDHLVWQLVLANRQKPGRRNAFPIVKDEGDWQRATRQLEGVSVENQGMIRYFQPYTGGINLPFDVWNYWKLHSLCNIDKHRHLNMVAVALDESRQFFERTDAALPGSNPRPIRGTVNPGKIVQGKILAWFNTTELIKLRLQICIQFEDVEDPEVTTGTVPNILDECLRTVRGAAELLTRRRRSLK